MFEWKDKASNEILLDDKVGGKGKQFRTRFLQAGLVKYSFGVCLLNKEAIDRFVYNFVGCPVIINHKDVTSDSAKDDRVGVISRVWFDEFDGWYWGEGVIFEQEALNLIDSGYNVSCQYEITEYSENRENKLHNGNPYDKTILNGRPEHLAIVKNPRYENAMIAVNAMEVEVANNEGKKEFVTVGEGESAHAIPIDYLKKDKEKSDLIPKISPSEKPTDKPKEKPNYNPKKKQDDDDFEKIFRPMVEPKKDESKSIKLNETIQGKTKKIQSVVKEVAEKTDINLSDYIGYVEEKGWSKKDRLYIDYDKLEKDWKRKNNGINYRDALYWLEKRTDSEYNGGMGTFVTIKKETAKNDIIQAINEIKESKMFKKLFKKEEKMDREEMKSIFMECLTELTAANEAEKKEEEVKKEVKKEEEVKKEVKKEEEVAENKCKNEEPDYKKLYEDLKAENEKAKEEEEKAKEEENKKAKNSILAGSEEKAPIFITEKRAKELGKELF